nr:hypothetical protein [Tanacetum cinerariifolium]
MSRDVITVGSTMRIPLMYRDEYSQWRERFMNYLEEQIDGDFLMQSITHGEQRLPVGTQVSLTGMGIKKKEVVGSDSRALVVEKQKLHTSNVGFHQVLDLMFKLEEAVVRGFLGAFILEFAAGSAVNLALNMKGYMIIENLNLKPTIDAMMKDSLEQKELSKELSSKILPCGDGSCWKMFKPIASLIRKGILKKMLACSFPICTLKV